FTHAEAQSLLPQVERLLRNALALKSEYEESEREAQAFGQRIMLMGGMVVDREKALEAKRQRESAAGRLRAVLEEIQETGCLIKDLDIGLVDFPTLLRGTEVYLCWKLGEEAIGYWHGVDEGFRGRKPIDQEFLDHHEGDRAQ
ncbi:MAG TPA: DUF2203 domain-containing protein, partial [Candidatus Sulfopaludibacter sp.]|nr:DUF2203 domain-containing protein [Candidatus Sulfopaludibacter sp.]